MFYMIKDVLINTKEIKWVGVCKFENEAYCYDEEKENRDYEDTTDIRLRVEYKDNSSTDIFFETEDEAIEELEKMYKKLNKPF